MQSVFYILSITYDTFCIFAFLQTKTKRGIRVHLIKSINELFIDYYIYIIGTHSCFRKNAKMQKCKKKFTAPGHAIRPLRIKNKRHGMAVKFSSPCKNHSLRPSKTMIPIKFYRNTKNNSFLTPKSVIE